MTQKTITGLNNIIAAVSQIVRDKRAFVINMARYFAKFIVPRHFTITAPGSYGYKPLSPKYAKYKAKKYPGKPMLVATGRLRREARTGVRVRMRDKKALVQMVFPKYGSYQIEDGRDFTKLSPKDKRDIIRAAFRAYKEERKKNARGRIR